jgi:hypothetical protein
MKSDDLESKLLKYYKTYTKGENKVGDWVVVDNKTFKKWHNKLKIDNFLMHYKNDKYYLYVCETKKEYIAIKYSDRFICYRISQTEYGLANDTYDLLTINGKTMENKYDKPVSFDKIAEDMGWTLSNKAKEYLSYYK